MHIGSYAPGIIIKQSILSVIFSLFSCPRNKRGLLPMDYAATEEMWTVLSTSTPFEDSGSSTQITSLPLSGRVSNKTNEKKYLNLKTTD